MKKKIAAIFLVIALMLVTFTAVTCWPAGANDSLPPEISEISVSCVGGNRSTVIISWTTNEPATGNIEYGIDKNYGNVCPTPVDTTPNNTNHSYTIINLSPDRVYHFRLKSTDDAGNEAISPDYRCPTSGTYSTGAKWSYDNTPSNMEAGQSYPVTVIVTNNGGLPWPSSGYNAVYLSYQWRIADGENVGYGGLKSYLTSDAGPGESATFNATVTAPSSPGSYILRWDMVVTDVTWFRDAGCSTLDVPVQVIM